MNETDDQRMRAFLISSILHVGLVVLALLMNAHLLWHVGFDGVFCHFNYSYNTVSIQGTDIHHQRIEMKLTVKM